MSWKATSFAFAFCITLTAVGNADTIVPVPPIYENTLIESSAGSLSNAKGNIYVGLTAQAATINVRRGLIEFPVAAYVPAGATITGGTLTMTDTTTSNSNGTQTLSLYDVSQAWGQGSGSAGGNGAPATQNDATWLYTFYNATTPSSSPRWNHAGGDSSLTPSGSAVDATNGQLVIWSSSSNSQMTTDIQDWLNSPTTNYGWLLQGNENESQSPTAKALDGMFSASPPVLTVSYTVSAPEPSTVGLMVCAALAVAAAKACRFGKPAAPFRP